MGQKTFCLDKSNLTIRLEIDNITVRESARWNTLISSMYTSERNLGLGSGPSPVSNCSPRSWRQQHNSGLLVSSPDGGWQQLEAGQQSFQTDNDIGGSSTLRSVCGEAQPPTPSVRQLAAGPGSSCSGRFVAAGSHVGRCLPLSSICTGRAMSPVYTVSPDIQSGPSSRCLERSDVLSTAAVCTTGLSVAATSDTGSSAGFVRRVSSHGSQPVTASRLATIRAAASDRGLSADASRLWVSSWRSSTQSSYESAWNVWIR